MMSLLSLILCDGVEGFEAFVTEFVPVVAVDVRFDSFEFGVAVILF